MKKPTVQVLLFSVLREQVGQGKLELPLPDPSTGSALLDDLQVSYPSLEAYRPVIRLAVNQTYASEETELAPGDEVALITPVSGG